MCVLNWHSFNWSHITYPDFEENLKTNSFHVGLMQKFVGIIVPGYWSWISKNSTGAERFAMKLLRSLLFFAYTLNSGSPLKQEKMPHNQLVSST